MATALRAVALPPRTRFPSTVTLFDPNPLKPARDNKKLGWIVKKGPYKGARLYALTLEERATCWAKCAMWTKCYGNHMPWAKRQVIGRYFRLALRCQLAELCAKHPKVLVRLHVLGDFATPWYVRWWRCLLERFPNLAVYGYTHYPPYEDEEDPRRIGIAVQEVLNTHERAGIIWSKDKVCGDEE